ncbi:hypothetical protein PFICI_02481 [Pestalotiopsis fici W106-1]|uniref:Helicase ATP-binding domain-containing protein n=1 Tax=Pestalotiopsis fici (strain W106-1 / CGMCC3.15140) TaxID=1229662 RepID=W3XGV3_PESFW|nr:uncharacterized protein PFICI_02481 [Pestalotiopsis fici W106-1]ETS84456.1 hypothetical protein PFICI_02481 [Pestalotiopsis fici W106-1]
MDSQDLHDTVADHVNFVPLRDNGWQGLPDLPTAGELNPPWSSGDISQTVMGVLGRNDITRAYGSKDHYLETHYRLNREEGVAFLRSGVREFKEQPWMGDTETTMVYTKVAVKGYLMSALGPVCRLQFSTERAGKRIQWSVSSRLTPGTVVAISTATDSFRSLCSTAVVMGRNIEDLAKSPPTIDIKWAETEQMVFDPTEELVMIEARSGFYEAVRHTLVGLQHVARSNSPLLKYLVEGSMQDNSPQFIKNNGRMDLTSILHHIPDHGDQRQEILNKYSNFDVRGGMPNEIRKYTNLDGSQFRAVHRLLTKELAICQGPPGTGKTYTSVQALQCMVNNLTAGMRKNPEDVIVVAAETNHAVDQILTHLIKAGVSVVRLGSRTRDEDIKGFSLFNLRRNVKSVQSRDYNNVNAARQRIIRDIELAVAEIFSKELLDPSVLHEYGIITKDQFDSVSGESWGWIPAPGRPNGIMAEWLDNAARDVQIHIKQSVFDVDEPLDERHDGVDTAEWELDVDDPTNDSSPDSFRLQGRFVEIKRKWGGENPESLAGNTPMLLRHLAKNDLWDIPEKWRGPIYEYWHKKLLDIRSDALLRLFANYTRICNNLKISGWKRDVECIKTKGIHVIGCTTTGLSKYRGLLAALEPKTLLVEEAAQSREAHIAAALLPSLQQLILVGDHQQLVPHCDVPGLADGFHNLTVSMFERLVEYLHLPYTILNQQRRMIPEIRSVLNPFYPGLGDHPVVMDKTLRPDVPGMPVNLYLFNHDWVESIDLESFSKLNTEEAMMVVRFAIYLLQNQVRPEQITILTFYRGQVKKIRKLLRQYMLPLFGPEVHRGVRLSTVDSYQGEENDIILLSLVRSNFRKNHAVAGFVGDMNRSVVSISRAKRGFYIFGNIDNLASATETSRFMWGNVQRVFEGLGRYSPAASSLPLRCQNHGNITYAANAEDLQTRHGGCFEKCTGNFQPCGHQCERLCHPMSHDKLICQHACERKLQCGHSCRNICGDDCHCEQNCAQFKRLKSLPTSSDQANSVSRFQVANSAEDTAVNRWTNWQPSSDRVLERPAPSMTQTVETNTGFHDTFRPVRIGQDGQRLTGRPIIVVQQQARSQVQVLDKEQQQQNGISSNESGSTSSSTTQSATRLQAPSSLPQQQAYLSGEHDDSSNHGLSDAFFQKVTIRVKRDRVPNEWEVSSEDDEEDGDQYTQLRSHNEDVEDQDNDDCESDLITF